jgi:hypothetical protein
MSGKTIVLAAAFLMTAGVLAAWGMGAFEAAEPAGASLSISPGAGAPAGCRPAECDSKTGAEMATKGGTCPVTGMSSSAAALNVASPDSGCCPSLETSKGAADAECSGCPSMKAGDTADAGCGDEAECGGSECQGDSCEKECEDCPVDN